MRGEEPAAFRERVFAGLRALETAGSHPGTSSVGATLGSHGANGGKVSAGGPSPAPSAPSVVGAQPAAAGAPGGDASAHEAHIAPYAAFEKSPNEDLGGHLRSALDPTLYSAF